MKRIVVLYIILAQALLLSGCTEQYALQTETFEDALVVEATLTNEVKFQHIKISHTYQFEQSAPQREQGAEVYVTDNNGTRYDFSENDNDYKSVSAFAAEPGKTYRLTIVTAQGRTYESSTETLTTVTPLQNVVATVMNQNGQRGVSIRAQSFDPANTSKYYRYEYDETFKVIAPKWSFYRAITVPTKPGMPDGIEIIPRGPGETRVCYGSRNSDEIILNSTNEQAEDRVDYQVRFISNQDPIITSRYSILVRQYVQSLAAYTFYKTLKELSGSGGILSQNQPGFFYGNMKSKDNPNEKVIGFFEVSSVSSKRIFFNFTDLFPGEPEPPYFVDCSNKEMKFCFSPIDPECRGYALLSAIDANTLLYNTHTDLLYIMVLPPCGDCTKISSNVRPEFWID